MLIKVTLTEITSFTWNFTLRQLHYFAGNFCVITEYKTFPSFLYSSCTLSICLILRLCLMIHWRFSTILNTRKKVYDIMFFWYVKVCILWKCDQYFVHWHKTEMLKNFLQKKQAVQKMPSFFFREIQLITVLLLICNYYISWRTKFVSLKLLVGFSIFDTMSFLLKFIFLLNKMHGLFDFKMS